MIYDNDVLYKCLKRFCCAVSDLMQFLPISKPQMIYHPSSQHILQFSRLRRALVHQCDLDSRKTWHNVHIMFLDLVPAMIFVCNECSEENCLEDFIVFVANTGMSEKNTLTVADSQSAVNENNWKFFFSTCRTNSLCFFCFSVPHNGVWCQRFLVSWPPHLSAAFLISNTPQLILMSSAELLTSESSDHLFMSV